MPPSRPHARLRLPTLLPTLALAWLLSPGDAHSGRADYTGAKRCGECHQAAYKAWQDTAHARADTSLGAKPAGACLGCHTTGEAPASRPFLPAVQCEACHGPGAGYAADDIMRDRSLATRLGLRDLSTRERRAALCGECHDSATRLTPFDAEAAYARIRH